MNKLIMILLSLCLPPLAVFIKTGVGKHLVINIILCLLFVLPGVIHALWINMR